MKPSRSLTLTYNQTGAIAAVLPIVLFCFVCFVLLPFFVLGKIVPPNKIGVRQNFISIAGLLDKGYAEEGLEPGLHWKIPYVSDIHLFPGTFQFVNLTSHVSDGELNLPALDVPTTDGSKVKTDLTLVMRLYRSPGGAPITEKTISEQADPKVVPLPQTVSYLHQGPQALVTRLTTSERRQLQRFADTAQKELRDSLSNLSTTDFYNPQLREHAAIYASDRINQIVGDFGMELWGSLIRRYVYADQSIDDQIFAKNLQDQTERLNAAGSLLAEAKALTERESALWDAKIRDLNISGDSKVIVVRSEGDLYESTQRAAGDLEVQKAKASVDKELAHVLSSSTGAEYYVAREMAPILATMRGGIISGIDPYDMDAWVKKLTKK